jgi:uncharacterized protein (TIGR02118 family)
MAGGEFDMSYYLQQHIPMVQQKLGAALRGVSVEHGLAGATPGSPPAYVAMGHLLFDSIEAFQRAWAPHAAAIVADVPHYTNTQPTLQVSDVKL